MQISCIPLVDALVDTTKTTELKPRKARVFFAGFGQSLSFLEKKLAPSSVESNNCSQDEASVLFIVNNYSSIDLDKESASNVKFDSGIDDEYLKVQGQDEASYAPLISRIVESEAQALSYALQDFDEIEVIAWSFGVRVAPVLLAKMQDLRAKAGAKALVITSYVNLAGTLEAVDRKYGIAPRSYDLTLKSLQTVGEEAFKGFLAKTLDKAALKLKDSFKEECCAAAPELINILEQLASYKDESQQDSKASAQELLNTIDRPHSSFIRELDLMVRYHLSFDHADDENAIYKCFKELLQGSGKAVKPLYIVNAFDAIMPFESQLKSALEKVGDFLGQDGIKLSFSLGDIVVNPSEHLNIDDLALLARSGGERFVKVRGGKSLS